MRAVVLVGGFGTRLRPLTATTPKQLLPVAHRPILEHVVEHLGRHGISEAVLALGYKDEAFAAAYPDQRCAGLGLRSVVEPEPLDTAGAVRFAADAAGIDETFVVVNGDVLSDLDVSALLARHRDRGAEATIALTRVADPAAYGVVPTDDEGRVLGFVEKPPPGSAPTLWVNAGCYVLEPAAAERIATSRPSSIERETFPAIAADGALWSLQSDAYWIDVGTPAAYLQAQLDLIDGLRGPAVEAVAADAALDPTATAQRSVVMSGARVGAGAVVRNSLIAAQATVGEGAVVDGSVVGPAAAVGAGATVGGLSVLGEGATVGAGQAVHGARISEAASR